MTGNRQKSLHGRKLYIDEHDVLIARGAVAAGGGEKPYVVVPGSPDVVSLWEDFIGDTGGIAYSPFGVAEGDTGHSASYLSGTTNGILRLTIGQTPTQAPTAVNQVASGLNWKAHQGAGDNKSDRTPVRMGVRLKTVGVDETSKRASIFVGFTDTGHAEMPVYDTGAGVISAATDAVGFILGSRADTGWSAVAVNNGTDATPVVVDTGWTDGQFDVLEIELQSGSSDTGLTANFYVNGEGKGSIDSPVVGTVPMTPIVAIFSEDTGGDQVVDIDWISVSGPRDTGA